MQHPSYEELLLHLEGGTSRALARRVEAHLNDCPECAAEVAGWQRTMEKLQKYDWPKAEVAPGWRWNTRVVTLAAAALIMAGFCFWLGHLMAPDTARLKASIAAELRAELRPELQADLVAQLQQVQQRQEENQQSLAAMLERVRQEHAEDVFSIRHDLETAVAAADQALGENRQSLRRLANFVAKQD
jgi:anti-sigma factor RsiW